MRCYIVVPETGAGPINAIIDAEQIDDYTVPENMITVGLEQVPGRPITTFHWDGDGDGDGNGMADGVYISPEAIAEGEAAQAAEAAQDAVDEHLAKAIDDLMGFMDKKFNLEGTDLTYLEGATTIAELRTALLSLHSMTETEKTVLAEFRTKYAAWLAAKI